MWEKKNHFQCKKRKLALIPIIFHFHQNPPKNMGELCTLARSHNMDIQMKHSCWGLKPNHAGRLQCAWHHSPPDSVCTPSCSTSAGDLNWILPPNPSKCSPSCLLDLTPP